MAPKKLLSDKKTLKGKVFIFIFIFFSKINQQTAFWCRE